MPDQTPLEVPLFPLDGVVLFPGTQHLFHIFEERYKLLVSEAIEGDRLIAVPLFRPGWEEHYFETPAVHRICGLGEITWFERLEEGRFNIAVAGRHRIRLIGEVQQVPFRIGQAELIEDIVRREDSGAIREEIAKLRRLGKKLTEIFPQFGGDLAPLVQETLTPSLMADTVAHRFVRDVYDRQSILNEADVCRRLQLTRVQLMLLLQRFMRENDYVEFATSLEGR